MMETIDRTELAKRLNVSPRSVERRLAELSSHTHPDLVAMDGGGRSRTIYFATPIIEHWHAQKNSGRPSVLAHLSTADRSTFERLSTSLAVGKLRQWLLKRGIDASIQTIYRLRQKF